MIEFKRNNTITYFKDEEEVFDWLVENYANMDDNDLLSEYSCCFPAWVNSNYSAFDILLDRVYCSYENLYELWKEDVLSDIRNGWFDELQIVEEKGND